MGKTHKPRAGSLAFHPRKKAKTQKAVFKSFNSDESGVKPLNFYGYKAGMLHVFGTNQSKNSLSAGQEIIMPVTVIETPALKVFGIKYYKKTPRGFKVLAEKKTEKLGKEIKKILTLPKKPKEQVAREKNKPKDSKAKTFDETIAEWLERKRIDAVRLLCATQPKLTGIGKKKPEIVEVRLSGKPEEQVKFGEEKLGKEIIIEDVFEEKTFLDVKAVTKGKGFGGPVKRFGIKIQGRKAKKHRIVGSIGPWHPATVPWTTARAGQTGYHTRTEYNKKMLKIVQPDEINPKSGFTNYGLIKNAAILVQGSVAGPVKRIVAMRKGLRKKEKEKIVLEEVKIVAQ